MKKVTLAVVLALTLVFSTIGMASAITNTVLAVNSYVTNSNCSGVGYSFRVDTPEVLKWINGFLP